MTIYDEIDLERIEQDIQWGGPVHDDRHDIYDWLHYIDLQMKQIVRQDGPPRQRLVKIAALAIAAIESMDRKDAA